MAGTTPKKATGSGAKISISTDGSAYKEFGSVTSVAPPNLSRGTVDATDLNSYYNNDQFKEYLGDFIDADDMTVEGHYLGTDEGREAAATAFYAGIEVSLKIQLPAAIGKSYVYKGILTAFRDLTDINTGAAIGYSLSLKPNAKPVVSSTASS